VLLYNVQQLNVQLRESALMGFKRIKGQLESARLHGTEAKRLWTRHIYDPAPSRLSIVEGCNPVGYLDAVEPHPLIGHTLAQWQSVGMTSQASNIWSGERDVRKGDWLCLELCVRLQGYEGKQRPLERKIRDQEWEESQDGSRIMSKDKRQRTSTSNKSGTQEYYDFYKKLLDEQSLANVAELSYYTIEPVVKRHISVPSPVYHHQYGRRVCWTVGRALWTTSSYGHEQRETSTIKLWSHVTQTADRLEEAMVAVPKMRMQLSPSRPP